MQWHGLYTRSNLVLVIYELITAISFRFKKNIRAPEFNNKKVCQCDSVITKTTSIFNMSYIFGNLMTKGVFY